MTFNRYKDERMCERKITKTMKSTQENRETLEGINGFFTKFIEDREDITLTELNTLHNLFAIVIAGVNSTNTKRDTPEFNSDQTTHLKIENIRKGIGRLASVNKSGK